MMDLLKEDVERGSIYMPLVKMCLFLVPLGKHMEIGHFLFQ